MSAFLRPWSGRWTRAQAAHLLSRAGLGATREELARSVSIGLKGTLEGLFNPPGHDPAMLRGIEPLLATGKIENLAAWWVALILQGKDPLRERVALLWHDHFATSWNKVRDVRLMHRQNTLLRENGLGDFRRLVHELARDPAMLVWLDGDSNRRGHPNENFAREVMELFTLGIGNFDEHDVQEAARAFTGWGTKGRSFTQRAEDQDEGEKEVLSRRGAFNGDGVLDVILAHPACRRHVGARLVEEFVGEEPTEAEIDALAGFLVENDWNIGATLEGLFGSQLFFDAAQRRKKITSPVEFAARACRALRAHAAPAWVATSITAMGQALFRPPSVKGWDGGRAWINASTWLERHDFAVELVEHESIGDLSAALGVAANGEHAEGVLDVLLPEGVGSPFRNTLERAIGNGAESVRRAVALVLTSAEYQLG